MNYGNIISRAWKSMWKQPILWIFALMAGQLTIRNLYSSLMPSAEAMPEEIMESYLQQLENMDFSNLMSFFAPVIGIGLAVSFLLGIIRFCVRIIGSVGMTRGLVWQRRGKPKEIGELLQESLGFFWRSVGLGAITFIFVLLAMTPFFGSVLLVQEDLFMVFCCLSCGSFLVLFCVAFFLSQVNFILLVRDCSIGEAISEGWNYIIRKHLGEYIVLAVIFMVCSVVLGLVASIPNLIFGVSLFSTFTMTVAENPDAIISSMGMGTRVISFFLQLYGTFVTALIAVFGAGVWVHMYLDLKESDMEENLPLQVDGEDVDSKALVEEKEQPFMLE